MSRTASIVAAASLVLASLVLGACQSSGPPAKWVQGELPAASHDVLWEVTRMSMRKAGFPVVSDPDPRTMTLESGWRQDLAPFRGKGFRERIVVVYKPHDEGRYSVQVRCLKEINKDIIRPLDATYAAWEPAEDNEARARIVLQNIHARLGGKVVLEDKKTEGDRD